MKFATLCLVMLSSVWLLGRGAQAAPQEPAAYISGRVTFGSTGQPVPGVRVMTRVISESEAKLGAWDGTSDMWTWYKGITERDGRYLIDGLTPGHYEVWIFMGSPGKPIDLAKDWVAPNQEVNVSAGRITPVNFQFVNGVIVKGHVTADDGKPVFGQYVGIAGPSRPYAQENFHFAVTKADGSFQFRVMPGHLNLWLHSNLISPPKGYKFLPARLVSWTDKEDMRTNTAVLFSIKSGEVKTFEFKLQRLP